VVDSAGAVVFDRQDIETGQEVFLKYGLMQNGSIWGHGSYSHEFIGSDRIRALEWVSMPSHVILIVVGVVPMVIASGLTYLKIIKN